CLITRPTDPFEPSCCLAGGQASKHATDVSASRLEGGKSHQLASFGQALRELGQAFCGAGDHEIRITAHELRRKACYLWCSERSLSSIEKVRCDAEPRQRRCARSIPIPFEPEVG